MTKGNPTNTPSIDDRELIESLRFQAALQDRNYPEPELEPALVREICDRLESLLSDRAKLEEALLDIRNRVLCPVGPSPTIDALQEIASAALTSRTDHTP